MLRQLTSFITPLLLLASACGTPIQTDEPAPPESPAVRALAEMGEDQTIHTREDALRELAPAGVFYSLAYDLTAETHLEPPPDPECPLVTRSAGRVELQGGCTDCWGTRYEGRLVVERAAADEADFAVVTYEGWSVTHSLPCQEGGSVEEGEVREGHAGYRYVTDLRVEFELDLILTRTEGGRWSCSNDTKTHVMTYEGTADLDEQNGPSTWNGAGWLGDSEEGKLSLSSEDERFDWDACSQAPLSGRTVLEAAETRAVLAYTGELDCGTGALTLNGEDAGVVAGLAFF